jgi:hypothetical protein
VLRHGAFTRLIGRRPRPAEIATAALTRVRQAGGKAARKASEPADGGSSGELTGHPGGTGRDRWTEW